MDQIAPKHVGIILDGNRRWAKARNLPTLDRHSKGTENIEQVLVAAFDAGVEYVSLYVFSTENWQRAEEEVGYLMKLFLRLFKREGKRLIEENVRVLFAGRRDDNVRSDILNAMDELEEASKDNTRGTVVFCFNYGGIPEITDAVKQIVASGIDPEDITPDTITDALYTPEVPACDLIIRTSGEQRLSNFQLWRSAYSEFLFVEKNWPDFDKHDMAQCLAEYQSRSRRSGK